MLDNHKGIVIKSLANNNLIGGTGSGDRNIISGNLEIGIYIEAADSNITLGNYIGTDITGMNKVAVPYTNPVFAHLDSLVQGNGIEFNSTAKYNVLGGYSNSERNIVSGHKVYGVVYYGNCSYNHIYNNFIGTDVTSRNPLPNATGICFDCASNHNDVINCVISGNLSYGLFYVTRGTEYNRFLGNMVGVDSSGTVAVPNDIGIVVSTGTAYNIIGGTNPGEANVFSGNRLSGMMLTNNLTEYNQIKGNYFGTDITGTFAIPNKYGITVTTFTKHNTIENNIISGNTDSGIILYEHADSNVIVNNKIGIGTGSIPLGNGAGGIYIDQGASYNTIGSTTERNTIAFNAVGGILIKHDLTRYNRLSGNSLFSNDGLGVDIFPFDVVNANDNGDWDEGPSALLNFPVISSALYDDISGITIMTGTIDCQLPQFAEVEIYKARPGALSNGQGISYLGTAIPDAAGNWQFTTSMIQMSDTITAIVIDSSGNTSEFCLNYFDIAIGNPLVCKNTSLKISPNPCRNVVDICVEIPGFIPHSASIIDARGNCVTRNILFDEKSGNSRRIFLDEFGLAPGQYIICIFDADEKQISNLMIVE